MKDFNVPIQSLIDHIKTATDVEPWAKEMAEDLLKEQEVKTVIKIAKRFNDCDLTGYCPFCSRPLIKDWAENYCGYCGKPVLWEGGEVNEID